MAEPVCDNCQEEQAIFLFGLLNEGARFVCGRCMALGGLELARSVLASEEIAEFLGPMFVKGGAGAATPPKRASRSRKGKAAAEPEPVAESAPAEGLEETPTTAQDA